MAKFCSKCGKAVNENAGFCDGCGNALSQNVPLADDSHEEPEKIVLEAKGSLGGGGMGTIFLTNKHIMWNKSTVENFIAGGVLSLLTKGSTSVNLDDILSISTFIFLGGAGLQVLANNGKKYKFGFNKKTERDQTMDYLKKNKNL